MGFICILCNFLFDYGFFRVLHQSSIIFNFPVYSLPPLQISIDVYWKVLYSLDFLFLADVVVGFVFS